MLWNFDRHMLVLKNFEATFGPNDHNLSLVASWIRIYDVVVGWMNRERVVRIGQV